MKKRTPTPVPPLGDAALSRIERGLFAALDARPLEAPAATTPGTWRRALVFAVAGVAATVGLFAAREGRRSDSLATRATQISTTTSGSRIAITGATLEVAPHSAISVGGGRDGAVIVALERGTVTCEVEPRSKRAPFVVEAGATHVTVIGTRFSVHRIGEHAAVSVEHGLVEVADTDMTQLVHAGERFIPGQPVTREPVASEAPAPEARVDAPGARSGAVETARVPAVEAARAPAVETKSVAAARPVAAAHLQRRRAALALAEDASVVRGDATHAATADDAREDGARSAASNVNGSVAANEAANDAGVAGRSRSVQVLFELAAQLELRDPEAALRIYGELAAAPSPSDGGWAASSLFAAARLEAERGHASQSRDLCDAYLRRFPRGANADDARTLLARAR
jgi:hypothetical protein